MLFARQAESLRRSSSQRVDELTRHDRKGGRKVYHSHFTDGEVMKRETKGKAFNTL